ncbi:hypothetical protein RKE29_02695 [Streptomyces sp. B1866]|uniref:hypothetical protein n=1 Tax=Streptomyces sp. B1866 TaxID=3075431 RepID=UPI00288FB964|nr:hypothetical protein [Streptomyces sp. B1866]MDT3395567.1 hypothetical protein [Streptomyces sp. B1866]
MITVRRTRLDDGAFVALRSTADDLRIVIDDRHITPAGATALERALNGLAPGRGRRQTQKPDPGKRHD